MKVKEWNKSFSIGVELVNKNEEIKKLQEQVRILERDLKIANDRLHITNYRSEQEEIIHLKLEKRFNKLNESYGALESENYKLRDLLKDLL